MIQKSGRRFSEKIMLKQTTRNAAQPRRADQEGDSV